MQKATIDTVVRPVVEEVVRLILGKIPQNGSLDLDQFMVLCGRKCPAVLELKPADCKAEECQYQLAVSVVASTVVFTLFFGAASSTELTARDPQIAQDFDSLVARHKKSAGGTAVIGRRAFSGSEAAWALAKKPR